MQATGLVNDHVVDLLQASGMPRIESSYNNSHDLLDFFIEM